jgi:thiamine-monophosphate kinase
MDRPTPRLALGGALRGLARSAADVSDGLLADLGHILAASGVGADVDAPAALRPSATWGALLARGLATPEQALDGVLAGGDDYELVFTAEPACADELHARSRTLGLPLTRIGRVRADAGLRVLDEQGRPLARRFAGFDHFA